MSQLAAEQLADQARAFSAMAQAALNGKALRHLGQRAKELRIALTADPGATAGGQG